ncbi:MAG: molybdopterin-dependent oxidoreductase [Geobacteraceae bacterium]|nr:molybdopterin-dependent oxidoreductase [Geobacteraceae bacterium]
MGHFAKLGCRIGVLLTVMLVMLSLPGLSLGASVSVSGEVRQPVTLSVAELREMPPFTIKNITLLDDKKKPTDPERLLMVASYKGVLLRDLLERAGMKHVRKFEPGVLIRVIGASGKEVVFSFGEIFYSSIGRSVLLGYERDGKAVNEGDELELITSTDVRSGRRIGNVREILVERVSIKLEAYTDKAKKIVRPTSPLITLIDGKSNKQRTITLETLKALPSQRIDDAVMTGDCEGFRGVYTFEGPTLRTVLESSGVNITDKDYRRYVVISSSDGFCAVYSFGEILNSRLSDNIIIAWKKNGEMITEDGFARSVVREDSTGGRSVRRISRIEIH